MTFAIDLPMHERVLGPLLADRARVHGERPYITFGDRTRSFAETDREVRAIGRGLRALGVEKGDMVALLSPNNAEFVLTWYACAVVGAVFVGLNSSYSGELLDYVLADSKPRGMVVERSLAGALATLPEATLQGLEWVAIIGGADGLALPAGPGRYVGFDELQIADGPDPQVESSFRDIQCISYTSGTTGPSKGVVMPNAHAFATGLTFQAAVGLGPDDVLYTPLPLFHGIASRQGLLPALLVGAHVVVGEKFSGSRFWQQVTECGATVAHTIFTIPVILKAQAPSKWDTAHRLRTMYNAHYDADFEKRFNVRLTEAYGLTETGIAIGTPWPERREGACGKAYPEWEALIVDEDGLDLPDGEVGELLLRPKQQWIMMEGYHKKDRETLEATRNFWFHTGDFAKRDADGYFYFVGRKKDRIRRRGENISGYEVERILGRHPEIAEVAAIPYPAAAGEDEVRCVIIKAEASSLTAAELIEWLRPNMPAFMLPRYVEFVDDMPRTPSAKIEKYKLIAAGLGPDAWDRETQAPVAAEKTAAVG